MTPLLWERYRPFIIGVLAGALSVSVHAQLSDTMVMIAGVVYGSFTMFVCIVGYYMARSHKDTLDLLRGSSVSGFMHRTGYCMELHDFVSQHRFCLTLLTVSALLHLILVFNPFQFIQGSFIVMHVALLVSIILVMIRNHRLIWRMRESYREVINRGEATKSKEARDECKHCHNTNL